VQYQPTGPGILGFQAHDEYLLKCVLSQDIKLLATTSADKTIKLWNTATWELHSVLAQVGVFSFFLCYVL
jgi:WD40 repeat protein